MFLEKCVLPFHFAQSSVLAISNSRHDNVRASSTLFIWLNENVRFLGATFTDLDIMGKRLLPACQLWQMVIFRVSSIDNL